ncbi:MAG: NAD(P)/FAD-dependent oxidoreductase [Lachnospiraceae bacterium]|nr:NAD(P)/FAD-dependent oxidoreductase [Lachnospiraceae bacterium]
MKKAVIIGAGPAGLTAAYELTHGDNAGKYDVTVLEESKAIGGISRTLYHNGNRMDIGGHRFFSKDDEILKWWTNILPIQGSPAYDDKKLHNRKAYVKGGPDPEKTDEVMLLRRRVSRIYYKRKFFDYPISMKPETIKNMGLLTTMKAGFSYLGSCIKKRPEINLENFYINRFGKVLYGMFFESYTEKLWGRHPSEISAEWGAQRVKGLSITALLKDMAKKTFGKKDNSKNVETSLIEEFWYPKYGPGHLWETVAKKIIEADGKIEYGAKVDGFSFEEGTSKSNHYKIISVKTGDKEYKADHVISSMPVTDLADALYENIPENIKAVANGLPYRDFVTVGLLVKKLDLVNKTKFKTLGNIVPDCWIYVQDAGVKVGRIQIFNNWSPYMVADPDNTVWIGLEYFCREGDEFWNMSDKKRTSLAIKELVKMGIIKKDYVLDSCCEKVKKAYPAYFDSYAQFDSVKKYLNSIENLYCVGRNGQHRYNNMDHSMATALRAVECINGKNASKDDIWNVNTEKSYHEKK